MGLLVDPNLFIICIMSVFLGGIIKGAVGIGMSMFSVPIIAFFLPPTTAMIFLCFPVLSTNILQMQLHKGIGSYRFLPMFLALVFGLIIGCNLILKIDLKTISMIISVSIIFASAMNLLGINFKHINLRLERKVSLIIGFFSGIIGGLSNMYSPYIIAFLVSVQIEKEFMIRTMATMYLIGSIIVYPLWIYNGLGSINDLGISLILIIPAILGQYFGTKIRNKLSNEVFKNLILIILMIIGISLLLKNL